MKYVCFGYYDKDKFDSMTVAERDAMFDTCFDYDDHLRANGHWAGGEALQPAETALTLIGRTAKSQLPTVPIRKPRNNLAAFCSLRRGT
jgi:hypothetical protein